MGTDREMQLYVRSGWNDKADKRSAKLCFIMRNHTAMDKIEIGFSFQYKLS